MLSVTSDVNATVGLQEIHDELLSRMPAGAMHDQADCVMCQQELDAPKEVQLMSDSLDGLKAAIDAAVAEATSPLMAKITELQGSHEEAALEARVQEAKAPLEAEVADLTAKLDSATAEAAAATAQLQATLDYFEAAAKEEEERAAFEQLKTDRVAQVREAASFSDEYIDANSDRWAKLDEEAFLAALEDWKLIASKAAETAGEKKTIKTENKEEIPDSTSMTAAAEVAALESHNADGASLMREVFDMTVRGFDPRTV